MTKTYTYETEEESEGKNIKFTTHRKWLID